MDRARPDSSRTSTLLSVAAVFAIFAAYSILHARIPGAGEGHYLTKARHFHDPSWCAGDLFLESSNPHWMFYATVGALTRWMPLDTVAWVGRGLGIALIAAGWTALVRRVAGRPAAAVPAAIVYVLIASIGNLSGEWLLDGVEGKLFAYGFLFLAMAWHLDGLDRRAAAAAGLAIAFHPIVGGWGIVAAAFAGVILRSASRRSTQGAALGTLSAGARGIEERNEGEVAAEAKPRSDQADRHSARHLSDATPPAPPSEGGEPERGWSGIVCSLVVLLVCALPGLIPAIASLGGGSSARADWIQVFYRLPHHLDPTTFSYSAWWGYAALIQIWLLGRQLAARTDPACVQRERWFACFVVGTLLIAAAGLVVGWGARPASPESVPLLDWRMRLMKFYPFRLADLFVPIAVAVTEGMLWTPRAGFGARSSAATRAGSRSTMWVARGVLLALLGLGLWNATNTPFRPHVPDERLADWRDACAWIRAGTPRDAVFLTPNEAWAFRWFAERPEYVSYKDCPQDSAGILEWFRRLKLIQLWFDAEWSAGYRSASTDRLHAETGITHLLIRDLYAFDAPAVYRNGTYAVYRIAPERPVDPAQSSWR